MSGNRFSRGLLAGVMLSLIVLIAALLLFSNLSSQSDDTPVPDAPSATATAPATRVAPTVISTAMFDFEQPNEQTLQRLIDDVLNDGNPEALSEIFAPNYIGHLPASETNWTSLTLDSYHELAILLHNSFPDLRITPEIIISDGQMVAMRAVLRGTFESEFYDFSPTHEPISVVFTVLYRFDDDGKIVEEWVEYDTLAFAQQFGIPLGEGD